MNSMSGEKLKGIPYTGTLPAVITGTKAGYLHKYKIYGNTEQTGTPTPSDPIYPSECGERTGNLFNAEKIVDDSNNASTYIYGDYLRFGTGANPMLINVNANLEGSYTISFDVFNATPDANNLRFTVSYDDGTTEITPNFVMSGTEQYRYTFTTDNNKKLLSFETINTYSKVAYIMINTAMLTEGSTPLPYEPYGYKLPLTSGSTPVDIYIGDDTLSTEEYVDSGTGKIYRMVSGVLTPVDPPVPFPQIPTTANSTTISWGGSGLAPSEFDSIQEWVDTPTYKRVNGEWVADN